MSDINLLNCGIIVKYESNKPTPAQIRALEAYIEEGSGEKAAKTLGISYQTLKNTLRALYLKLGVNSAMGAAKSLGYIKKKS